MATGQTAVSLCNTALAMIGQNSISSLGEKTNRSLKCNTIYNHLKCAVLRMHPWKSASLGVSIVPSAGFTTGLQKFVLPTDFLRVIRVWFGNYTADTEDDPKYIAEGDGLHLPGNSTQSLNVRYVSSTVPESNYDSLLADAISARIAADLAYSLVNSTSLKQEMMREFEHKLARAKAIDSQINAITDDISYQYDDYERGRVEVYGPHSGPLPEAVTSPYRDP